MWERKRGGRERERHATLLMEIRICGNWFSPSTLWISGIELILSGLVAGSFTWWALFLALYCFFWGKASIWTQSLLILQNLLDHKPQGSFFLRSHLSQWWGYRYEYWYIEGMLSFLDVDPWDLHIRFHVCVPGTILAELSTQPGPFI